MGEVDEDSSDIEQYPFQMNITNYQNQSIGSEPTLQIVETAPDSNKRYYNLNGLKQTKEINFEYDQVNFSTTSNLDLN